MGMNSYEIAAVCKNDKEDKNSFSNVDNTQPFAPGRIIITKEAVAQLYIEFLKKEVNDSFSKTLVNIDFNTKVDGLTENNKVNVDFSPLIFKEEDENTKLKDEVFDTFHKLRTPTMNKFHSRVRDVISNRYNDLTNEALNILLEKEKQIIQIVDKSVQEMTEKFKGSKEAQDVIVSLKKKKNDALIEIFMHCKNKKKLYKMCLNTKLRFGVFGDRKWDFRKFCVNYIWYLFQDSILLKMFDGDRNKVDKFIDTVDASIDFHIRYMMNIAQANLESSEVYMSNEQLYSELIALLELFLVDRYSLSGLKNDDNIFRYNKRLEEASTS